MSTQFIKLPAGIDFHVHFREPGYNCKENMKTGKKAAYLGGIDTVIEMPNTDPPVDTLEAYNQKVEFADRHFSDEENRGNRVKIINAISLTNRNTKANSIKKLLSLVEQARIVKVFMANSTGNLAVSKRNMLYAFEQFATLSRPPLVIFHAEDPKLIRPTSKWQNHLSNRPVQAEINAIDDILEFNDRYNIMSHITHISTGLGATKLSGESQLTWDTCPKYLQFSWDDMERLENYGVMNPPLRVKEDMMLLNEFFQRGKIPIIASDHAPHTHKDKEQPVSGAPGVQELYPFLIDQYLNANISYNDLSKMIFSNPSQVLRRCGIFIEKEYIYVNPEKTTDVTKSWIQSKCKWSLWEGRSFKGKIMRN